MSESNVELHRRLTEAFNTRDLDAMLVLVDPSCEWHSAFAEVFGGVYHGHDGVRKWHRDLEEAWGDEIRVKPETYFDLGEHTLSFQVLHGRGRHSGAEVVMPAEAHVLRWRDGQIVYCKEYDHREDALSDLGISDDELERIDP
jgi:ketosteroid isomerase-like protein